MFLLSAAFSKFDLLVFTARAAKLALQAQYMVGHIRPSVCLSACPSVRPSHSGIVSKRGNAEDGSLQHRVAQCLYFSYAKNG